MVERMGSMPDSINREEERVQLRLAFEWTCPDCGAVHDRDHNAALNILRLGHQVLAAGAA